MVVHERLVEPDAPDSHQLVSCPPLACGRKITDTPAVLQRLEVRRDARRRIQGIAHPVDDEERPVDEVRDEQLAVGAGRRIRQHAEVADERQERREQRRLAHGEEVGAGAAVGGAGEVDVRLVDVVLPLHAIDERQDVVDLRAVPPRRLAPAERVHDDLRLAGHAVAAAPAALFRVLSIDAAMQLHAQRPAAAPGRSPPAPRWRCRRPRPPAPRRAGALAGRRGGVGAPRASGAPTPRRTSRRPSTQLLGLARGVLRRVRAPEGLPAAPRAAVGCASARRRAPTTGGQRHARAPHATAPAATDGRLGHGGSSIAAGRARPNSDVF